MARQSARVSLDPVPCRRRPATRLTLGLVCLALSHLATPHGSLRSGAALGQPSPDPPKPAASQADGGLARQAVVPRLTREELTRKFDLNRDGVIDQGELEVASSKMRLERAQMRLSQSVDPVTGLSRDAESDGLEPDKAGEAPLSIDELARRLGLEAGEPLTPPVPQATPTPGGRPLQPRIFGFTPGPRSAAGAMRAEAIPTVPGGARAGGRPALPGYGSGVRPPSLNAGRADQLPSATAERRIGGGLVPRLEPPRPAPPRPQRTVEDFNVY